MNKDFWKRIDRLEELVNKATQGKWNYCGCEIWANETTISHDVVGKVEKFEDAQYIGAADPAMILEMITELKKYWMDAADYASYFMYLATYVGVDDEVGEQPAAKDIYHAVFTRLQKLKSENSRLQNLSDYIAKEALRLQKEADWLAERLKERDGRELIIPRKVTVWTKEQWCEAARKAVSEADNA